MMTKTLDVSKAKCIDGWMKEPELLWLAERAGEHRVIVEIGSYLGRSTRAMLDHMNEDGTLYAFDDWRGPRDVYLPKEERDNLMCRFMENVELTKIGDDKLHMVVGKLEDTYRDWEVRIQPDLVFIDGSHDYEDVKNDLLFWKDKLVDGGLLCGHDIDLKDVRKALSEVFSQVEVAANTMIWYKVIEK